MIDTHALVELWHDEIDAQGILARGCHSIAIALEVCRRQQPTTDRELFAVFYPAYKTDEIPAAALTRLRAGLRMYREEQRAKR